MGARKLSFVMLATNVILSGCTSGGGLEPVGFARLALDSDGDGIDDADDNCDSVDNRGQQNCNLDSELEDGVTPAGDACDPNPCPYSLVVTGETAGTFYVASAVFARLHATVPRTSTGGTASAVEGWTGARFCDCSAVATEEVADGTGTRGECADPMGGDCEINDTAEYDAPTAFTAWSSPTLDFPSVSTADLRDDDASVTDGDQDEVILDYGDTGGTGQRNSASMSWDFIADESLFDYTLSGSFNEFSFPSVTWSHVAEARNSVTIDRDLTSHYWSGIQARGVEDGRRPTADPPGLFIPYLIPPNPICPLCSYARGSWSYLEDAPTPVIEVWFGTMTLDAGGFYEWGTPEDLDGLTGQWVHASEPDVWREPGTLHALISADGEEVKTLLAASAGNGYSRSDVNKSGPSALSAFGAVLSQRHDALYVIGGLDNQGAATRTLWTYHVGNDSWSSTAISNQGWGPERVLAAAYAPGEDALLVLDRPVQGSTVRLWRLPLPFVTDAIEGVKAWSSGGVYSEFGMTVDTEGESYYVLCDRGQSGHAVLRLDADDGSVDEYTSSASELEQTALLGHEWGVSLLALDGNDVPVPMVHDDDAFTTSGQSTADLCFD